MIVEKIYRHNKKKNEKKRARYIKSIFPDSNVDSSVTFNRNTTLEGNNVIYHSVNISDSSIGFATLIGPKTHLSNCKIGRFCSIAHDVSCEPYTHPTANVSTYPSFFNTGNNLPFGKSSFNFEEMLKTSKGFIVEIGNDVWIGSHVTIKGGIKIGDGAIIGMNALVTKDVPPYSIVGGVPAKIIRYRFNKSIIEGMLRIQWWNWPIELIKQRQEEFISAEDFVKKYDR